MSRPKRFIDSLDHDGRTWEWVSVFALSLSAIAMSFPGDTLRYGIYSFLKAAQITETVMVLFFVSISVFRGMSLWFNGMVSKTPLLRGIGSIMGVSIWGSLFILSMWEIFSPNGGTSTVGFITGFFLLFAFCDVKGIIRAGKDAARARMD